MVPLRTTIEPTVPTSEFRAPTLGPVRSRLRPHRAQVRTSLGAALQVLSFGLRTLATHVERAGRSLVTSTEPTPVDYSWTEADRIAVELDRPGAATWAMDNVDMAAAVRSNCAYFVSEALRVGGGLATTPRWRPGTTHGHLRRWHRIAEYPAYGCVGDFVIEMQRTGNGRLIGVDTMDPRPALAELGDVIVYNWDGRGRYQHLAVVTAFVDGVMRVTQQTPSQLNRPWNRYGDGRWIATASLLRFATSPTQPQPNVR